MVFLVSGINKAFLDLSLRHRLASATIRFTGVYAKADSLLKLDSKPTYTNIATYLIEGPDYNKASL